MAEPQHAGSQPPDLATYLAWLDQLIAHTTVESATQTDLRRVLHELEQVRALAAGTRPPDQSIDELRWLIAGGLLQARGLVSHDLPADTNDVTAQLFLVTVSATALWPLIIAKNLPLRWEDTLEHISSPAIAELISDLRLQHRTTIRSAQPDPVLWPALVRSLANPAYRVGIYNLLDDLRDPQRGGAALVGLALASHHPLPPPDRSMRDLLHFLVAAGMGAAVSGVIGNRVDALVVRAWELLAEAVVPTQPTASGAERSLSTPQLELITSQDQIKYRRTLPTDGVGGNDRAYVQATTFAPDGHTLASGDAAGIIKLWHVRDGRLLHTLQSHTDQVDAVAFAPDGHTLASVSVDKTVKLWRVQDGHLLHTLQGHSWVVRAIAFAPDGQTLASGSGDHTVKLWRMRDGHLLHTLQDHTAWVEAVAFAPDGQTLASGSRDHTVKLWRMRDRHLLHTLPGHTTWFYALAFAPDGQTLASASTDGIIRLWRVRDGHLLRALPGYPTSFYALAFAPDGQTLASAFGAHTIMLWRAPDWKLVHTEGGVDMGVVSSITFAPDGALLAAGSKNNLITLYRFHF